MVSAPQVLYQNDPETGKKLEPYEEATVECPSEHQGVVMEEFTKKHGIMRTMEGGAIADTLVMAFTLPTAGMIGMHGKLQSKTRGSAVVTSRFSHWGECQKTMKIRDKGSICNVGTGKATADAIKHIQSRGTIFINPGDEVFPGMCIGINRADCDLACNIAKEKQSNNVR